jgi:2-keto-4-pentenoate hydratase/2-oxohepta-3-ene-1,7-dioic acid hydratase in catechol pathway
LSASVAATLRSSPSETKLTLYPGDVLWMGTDGATENMQDGDVVEVPGIGGLRNPVIRER